MTATKEKTIEHFVDLGADPYIPNGWTDEEHRGEGIVRIENRNNELYINDQKIVIHLSERQMDGKTVTGYELREELTNKLVLNANVLDYLLEHPELIPASWKWKCKRILFWGTIYRDSGGDIILRSLYWSGGPWLWRWGWDYHWLEFDWDSDCQAAVLEEAV